MKFVLDSSVALKWVLPEHDSTHAIWLQDDFHIAVHELLERDARGAIAFNSRHGATPISFITR